MRPRDIVFALRVVSFCKTGVLVRKGHVVEKIDMLKRKERNDFFDTDKKLQFVLLCVCARKIPMMGEFFMDMLSERITDCPNLRWFISYFSTVSRFSKNMNDRLFALSASIYFGQFIYVLSIENPPVNDGNHNFVLDGLKATVRGDDTLRNEMVRLDNVTNEITPELRFAYEKCRAVVKNMPPEQLSKYGLDRDCEK